MINNREISISANSKWLIFEVSGLKPKEMEVEEKWGWTLYTPSDGMQRRTGLQMIRNVQTEGHPRNHRREILVRDTDNGTWRWEEDKKKKLSPEITSYHLITNTLKTKIKLKNHFDLSTSLQRLIVKSLSNYLFQGRRRPSETLRNKLKSITFVDVNAFDRLKEWVLFDKQWLYEQIRASRFPDSFVVGGLCANLQTKNDAELEVFLQQQGLIPTNNTTQQSNLTSNQNNSAFSSANTGDSSNSESNNNSSTGNNNSSNHSEQTNSSTQSSLSREETSPSSSQEKSSNSSTFASNDKISDDGSKYVSPANTNSTAGSGGAASPYSSNKSSVDNNFSSSVSSLQDDNEPKNLDSEENSSQASFDETKDNYQPFKKEIIKEIQNKLKSLPSIDLKTFNGGQYQNWEQEINQLATLKETVAYQQTLLKSFEQAGVATKKCLYSPAVSQDKSKNIVPWIMLGIILISGLVLLGKFRRKEVKSKIKN